MMDGATLSLYGDVVMAYVLRFFSDIRVAIIFGLILLDVCLAIAVAIKSGTFDGRRLGEYMKTMVLPYIVGYMALYLFARLMAWSAAQSGADLALWLGDAAGIVSEAVIMGAWLTLVYNLGADVLKQLKALRYPFADGLGIKPGGSADVSGEVDATTKPPNGNTQ